MTSESPTAPQPARSLNQVMQIREMHTQEEYYRVVGAPVRSETLGWMEASELLLASVLAYGSEFLPAPMALRHFSVDLIVAHTQSNVVTLEVDRVSYSERHTVLEVYLYSVHGAMVAKGSATWS